MNNLKYLLKTFNVFGYNKGNWLMLLTEKLSHMYSNENVFVTLNGRTAIHLFLESLGLNEGDKVVVQAFTCNAVINPILSLGLTPVYVDIDRNTFNMSFDSLQRTDLSGVKVLILQHSFGIGADERIFEYCKQKGILVLEDCAHTLGDTGFGKSGDAMMLSFGLEKLMPTRVGGALVVNNERLVGKVEEVYKGGVSIGKLETFRWMVNPLLWRIVRMLPDFASRFSIDFLKGVELLKSGFSSGENNGGEVYLSFRTISPILAEYVLTCLSVLDINTQHRKKIADIYREVLEQKYPNSIIRYPYVAKSSESFKNILHFLESEGYPTQERWFAPVIFPSNTDLDSMKYVKSSCPVAEDVGSKIVNLPTGTFVTEEKAWEIAKNVLALM